MGSSREVNLSCVFRAKRDRPLWAMPLAMKSAWALAVQQGTKLHPKDKRAAALEAKRLYGKGRRSLVAKTAGKTKTAAKVKTTAKTKAGATGKPAAKGAVKQAKGKATGKKK